MDKVLRYKKRLGLEIRNFLDGVISFEELESRIANGDYESVKDEELIKLTWHAIYQYECDVEVDDLDYSNAIRNKMREISRALIENDSSLPNHLDSYFNDPTA